MSHEASRPRSILTTPYHSPTSQSDGGTQRISEGNTSLLSLLLAILQVWDIPSKNYGSPLPHIMLRIAAAEPQQGFKGGITVQAPTVAHKKLIYEVGRVSHRWYWDS